MPRSSRSGNSATRSSRPAWEQIDYQRIIDGDVTDGRLRVVFADGETIEAEPRELLGDAADRLDWTRVTHAPEYVSVPLLGSDECIEVPWIRIRSLHDDAFATHLAAAAERQAEFVGQRLRQLREDRGLAAKVVAQRAGITPQSLSRIEHGHHDVVYTTLRRILSALNAELADLADESEDPGEADAVDTGGYASPVHSQGRAAFVREVADKAGLSEADAERAVQAILDTLTEALRSGESVTFRGFGKFETVRRSRRSARDFAEAQEITAAVPKFLATRRLREAVQR